MFYHNLFVLLIITIFLQNYVDSNKDNKLKSATIDSIVEKICNITLNSLADKPREEKLLILANIEDKLKKSAIGHGVEGHKYVKFIMHGIKLIAFNDSMHTDFKNESVTAVPDKLNAETTSEELKAKEQAIHNIAMKIEKLAKKYMKDAETPESKQAVIDKIKNKVMDAANRRHMLIHNKHKEIKSYGDIIAKGIDLMIKNNVAKDTRRKNFDEDSTSDKGVRLKIIRGPIDTTPSSSALPQHPKVACDKILEEMCSYTKALNNITCRYDKTQFPLVKLCDGVTDCPDESDERDCAEQAIDRIKNSGRIMFQIESAVSQGCISESLDQEILSEQNLVLRGILRSQLEFIEKYAHPSIADVVKNRRRSEVHKNIIKKTTHEIALVVSSLAMALEGSLCTRRVKISDIDKLAIKYTGDTDADEALDSIIRPRSIDMASCICNGMGCGNNTCSRVCTRVCWQKYALNRWACRAVDGGPSISLDSLCDGKLDCYDETDETGCALGSNTKFEAGKIYDNILKLVSSKTQLNEYNFIISDLVSLYDAIKSMQKLSAQPRVQTSNLKLLREQCFFTIQAIHDAFISLNSVKKLNNGYQFLSSVSEQLMNAMKRSKTGNDRIISSDKCLCTGTRCAMPRCSKLCVRACSAEPNLTRYLCGDMKINKDIPISNICNGKNDCPNGEDEQDCSKDVCRSHHLILLRHQLKDTGLKYEGSALGEVLKSWKTKVTSAIMIAEKEGRPTPKELKDIISKILQDLVMSYASLNFSRRNNESNVLKHFIKISQHVMDAIKSCGQ